MSEPPDTTTADGADEAATVEFDPSRPPAPAMSQDEVGRAWDALCRIPCELERHCLYAATTWPDGYDNPAQAVRDAAGCPDRCLCATDVTPQQAAVSAVAVTSLPPGVRALAGRGLGVLAARQVSGGVPVPHVPAAATLRDLPGLDSLVDRPSPDDAPLPAERAIVPLAGGVVGPSGLGLDLATFTIHEAAPVEPSTADEGATDG